MTHTSINRDHTHYLAISSPAQVPLNVFIAALIEPLTILITCASFPPPPLLFLCLLFCFLHCLFFALWSLIFFNHIIRFSHLVKVIPESLFPICVFWASAKNSPELISVLYYTSSLLGGSDGKESTLNAGDLGSTLESGRSPGEGHGNPLQYSCLENSMDQGAWWAMVHGVAKSQTRLSD